MRARNLLIICAAIGVLSSVAFHRNEPEAQLQTYSVSGRVYRAWETHRGGEWAVIMPSEGSRAEEARKAVEELSGCAVVKLTAAPAGSIVLARVSCSGQRQNGLLVSHGT